MKPNNLMTQFFFFQISENGPFRMELYNNEIIGLFYTLKSIRFFSLFQTRDVRWLLFVLQKSKVAFMSMNSNGCQIECLISFFPIKSLNVFHFIQIKCNPFPSVVNLAFICFSQSLPILPLTPTHYSVITVITVLCDVLIYSVLFFKCCCIPHNLFTLLGLLLSINQYVLHSEM